MKMKIWLVLVCISTPLFSNAMIELKGSDNQLVPVIAVQSQPVQDLELGQNRFPLLARWCSASRCNTIIACVVPTGILAATLTAVWFIIWYK